MNLFIVFIIGTFVLSIRWRGYAGKNRSKRLLSIAILITFAYYFLNMV